MKTKRFIDANQILDERLAPFKKTCKCGHTMYIIDTYKRDYRVCNHCGSRIYKDSKKQEEYDNKCKRDNFKFILRKKLEILK